MKRVLLFLSLIVGFVCINAANVVKTTTDFDPSNPPTDYYIYCPSTNTAENANINFTSGYAGTTLVARNKATVTTPDTYVWSATFSGDCDRYYIWPTGGRADVSIYVNDGQTGGVMRVICEMYKGSTLLATAYMYVTAYNY